MGAPAAALAAAVLFAPSALAAPDIELGRYLANECMTCHRAGAEKSTTPNVFGLAETRFAELLKAYRDKRLANPVMQNIASRLSDEDIAALALFFASVKKP
jgi:cytochrome c